MKKYIQALFPADFTHNPAYWRAFTLGMIMLAMAVLQLFQFEDLPGVLTAVGMPGGTAVGWVLAVIFPALEIASLPYLMSMKITVKQRRLSLYCAYAAALLWLAVTAWTSLTMGASVQSGVFGASLPTASGFWSVLFALLLLWSVYLTARELPRRTK